MTSMAVALVDHMGSDLTVVNAARVSFGKHSDDLDEKDEKLITYLAEHGHWSPFAHAFIQFRIKAPIFVARQLVKHQVGLTNEFPRYVDDEPEFYRPKVWRGRAANKQGSEAPESGRDDAGRGRPYHPHGTETLPQTAGGGRCARDGTDDPTSEQHDRVVLVRVAPYR